MVLDTVVRVVFRTAVIDVHRATLDTTYPLTLAIRTNVVAQTVPGQQVSIVQPTMPPSAVHAIPVTIYQVVHVFRINASARMVLVQQATIVQLTTLQSVLHVTTGLIYQAIRVFKSRLWIPRLER